MSTQLNVAWNKWIARAVTKHFVTQLSPLKVYAQNEPMISIPANYAKVRIYGEDWREHNSGNWEKMFTVDVLSIAGDVSNIYDQDLQASQIAAAFLNKLVVEDDVPGYQLIISRDYRNKNVNIQALGQRDKGTVVTDHSITCQYRGFISNG